MNRSLVLILFLMPSLAYAGGYKEKDYRNAWCGKNKGVTEYVLSDRTRVDCLTEEYAIEFDWAKKWAEAIGQSLYYSLRTKRKPGIVIIIRSEKDERYLKRLRVVTGEFKIKVWVIGPGPP